MAKEFLKKFTGIESWKTMPDPARRLWGSCTAVAGGSIRTKIGAPDLRAHNDGDTRPCRLGGILCVRYAC